MNAVFRICFVCFSYFPWSEIIFSIVFLCPGRPDTTLAALGRKSIGKTYNFIKMFLFCFGHVYECVCCDNCNFLFKSIGSAWGKPNEVYTNP